ncbi:MAG: bifunctional tRNA (5-methylaminomethyl-2-thiouridine)(34)-methyltransferase MnmD/FAD-dependent 5-carboxymethylaminomethyl-2-thiouridine(34) oxidoreductase MnmC [Alphaproteobacteria bacterium]|nr:bifunctional tRNA (5-methylaminomethyl-2-thiouridine)(34)-methyltransferase MnmD/FAD-dependent 5-carboxymethylaminomethyl-2-thiouridine(34) oxidoreductase MnmC [Alphaproteobacteria bacterium]
MKGAPRSKEFDDIYFSQEDGLAEAEFVFLKGNNLPDAWRGEDSFTIVETGFGTGLNFLASWDLFEKTAESSQRLNFISFEQYPLSVEEIRDALAPWVDRFGAKIDRFLDVYPLRIPGVHSLCISENVFLTLIFDDVNDALPKLSGHAVDAWFLDGFTPSKNPEMWTEAVFESMARLSHDKTSFATFTAAGFVKRGLEDAGFDVSKSEGFRYKRELLVGRLPESNKKENSKTVRSVAIIGGGLAGCAMAYWLKKQGLVPTVFEAEAELASGASGNKCGMLSPRLSKLRNVNSDFYMQSFAMAIRELGQISKTHDIEFSSCGALHLMHNENMKTRYPSMVENWGWHSDHARIVDRAEASAIAGVEIEQAGLYLPDAAMANPAKLCHAYVDGIDVVYNAEIRDIQKDGTQWNVNGEAFDAVVLANAMSVKLYAQTYELVDKFGLYPVRGQVSLAPSTPFTEKLNTILNYRGYLSPAYNGVHAIGSTFDRTGTSYDLLQEDHDEVISHMEETVPCMKGQLVPNDGRAGFRVSCKYRFPISERVAKNMYVSTAHGSHGLISSLQCAAIIHNHLCSGLRVYP